MDSDTTQALIPIKDYELLQEYKKLLRDTRLTKDGLYRLSRESPCIVFHKRWGIWNWPSSSEQGEYTDYVEVLDGTKSLEALKSVYQGIIDRQITENALLKSIVDDNNRRMKKMSFWQRLKWAFKPSA